MTTPTGFKRRLHDELLELVTARAAESGTAGIGRPQTTRTEGSGWLGKHRLVLVGAGAVLGIATAVALPLAVNGGSTPAFALTPQGDGTYLVALDRPAGLSGLQQALRGLGIKAVAMGTDPHCVEPGEPGLPVDGVVLPPVDTDPPGTIRIRPAAMPAADTLFVVYYTYGPGRGTFYVSLATRVPSCVAGYPPPRR